MDKPRTYAFYEDIKTGRLHVYLGELPHSSGDVDYIFDCNIGQRIISQDMFPKLMRPIENPESFKPSNPSDLSLLERYAQSQPLCKLPEVHTYAYEDE